MVIGGPSLLAVVVVWVARQLLLSVSAALAVPIGRGSQVTARLPGDAVAQRGDARREILARQVAGQPHVVSTLS